MANATARMPAARATPVRAGRRPSQRSPAAGHEGSGLGRSGRVKRRALASKMRMANRVMPSHSAIGASKT